MINIIKKCDLKNKIKPLIILLMIGIILYALSSDSTTMYSISTEIIYDGEFSQIIDGEEIFLENISDFQDVSPGETLVLTTEIPKLYKDKVLLFYTKDIEVKIYIDDVEVYNFQAEDSFEYLKTPGNKWNYINISTEMSGSSMRIELTSNFTNRYTSTINKIYLINGTETLSVILTQDGFRILMSLVIFTMSFLVYVNAFVWQRKVIKRYCFHLANLYLCTALWLSSMYNAFDYFIQKPIFSYIISMLMAIFIPVVLFEFTKAIYNKRNKILEFLGFIVWTNFIIQLILQFIFKISLLNLLPITYIVYSLGALSCIIFIIHHIITCKNNINFALVTLLIIFFGGVVEIAIICIFPERTDLIGFAAVLGLFIYLLVNHFHILVNESRIDVQKIELEKNYNKLQSTTLMQQIKAHFFFNTLNTISALCKFDPMEADRAILIFAKYMRSYMKLINKHENISFLTELEILEASLKIEKLRFPDTFTYNIDLEFTDFEVPPLSIQPIIENSMIHGLRKVNKKGMINIKTKKFDDYVQIKVSDNGVGFNTEILETSQSIGVKNLKKRFKIMVNGTVEINSEINKGTETTITIPLK